MAKIHVEINEQGVVVVSIGDETTGQAIVLPLYPREAVQLGENMVKAGKLALARGRPHIITLPGS